MNEKKSIHQSREKTKQNKTKTVNYNYGNNFLIQFPVFNFNLFPGKSTLYGVFLF